MGYERTLSDAKRILEDAKAGRAVDLHPHARQHQIPIKDIEAVLAQGTLGYSETPPGSPERYTLDLQFSPSKRLRLILTLEESPSFCLIIAAYEKW